MAENRNIPGVPPRYLPVPLSVRLTPLQPQSDCGDKPLRFQVVCPQNGTAILKGLSTNRVPGSY